MKRLIFQRLALRALIIVPVFASGCDSNAVNWYALFFEKRAPALEVPFRLDKAGFVLETDYETKEKTHSYGFELAFKPKIIDSQVEQAYRVTQLLERNHANDQYTNAKGVVVYPRHGIRVPLKLTITRLESSKKIQIYDQTFEHLYSPGGGSPSFLPSQIDNVVLEPGRYRFRLEALEAVPELADIDVEFYLYTGVF